MHCPKPLGGKVHNHVLEFGPILGSGSIEVLVVRLVEHDRVESSGAQLNDVVRSVIDVNVCTNVGLVAEEADISVRDAMGVEPLDRVRHRRGMTPVDVQPVRNDPNVYTGVGQSPERIGHPVDDGHVREQTMFGDGHCMQPLKAAGPLQIPLSKVPRPLQRKRFFGNPKLFCDDRAKGGRIVAADTVEIDSKYEWLHRRKTVAAPTDKIGEPRGEK